MISKENHRSRDPNFFYIMSNKYQSIAPKEYLSISLNILLVKFLEPLFLFAYNLMTLHFRLMIFMSYIA